MAIFKLIKPAAIILVNLILLCMLAIVKSNPVPASLDSSSDNGFSPGDVLDNSWFLGILSICVLVTLISIVFVCGDSQGCWGKLPKIHWFGRTRQDVPMSFENPVVELGNSMPLSQIDVRALELDPIVFEPLPTIHDLSLTPQTPSVNAHSSAEFSARPSNYPTTYPNVLIKNPSAVIPFATEDSQIYAHDWFDEPFRNSNFPRNSLEFNKVIGKGWFGQVLEAQAQDIVPFANKMRVFVKLLREDASQFDQIRFLDESRVYRDANQGNILKLLGHSIEQLPFLLIMELCPQGDLKSYLISNVTRAEMLSNQGTLIKMALDIARGLEWMTTNGFKHHDLAARNCQVASEGRIVIGDYGLATQAFRDDYYWNANVPIPLRWAAPETLHCTPTTIQTLKVTHLSNVWSFAVVLWEITEFGKLPYFELSDEEVITRVLANKNYFLGSPTLPYIPLKDELYSLMRSCWTIDPNQRPQISTLVNRLQSMISSSLHVKSPIPDENDFDTKWEKHGKRSISTSSSGAILSEDQPRVKKSVSFTGIVKELDFDSDGTPETEKTRLNDSRSKDVCEMSKIELKVGIDEDQEQELLWESGVEQGAIAQKVMEKSQSVQNLMVLTHVEPSEFGDMNSFTNINGSHLTSDKENSSSEQGLLHDNSNITDNTLIDETISVYPESSQSQMEGNDTSIVFESSMENTSEKEEIQSSDFEKFSFDPSSILRVPDISILPATPGTTPNLTNIDINITNASPIPSSPSKTNSTSNNSSNSDNSTSAHQLAKDAEVTDPSLNIKHMLSNGDEKKGTSPSSNKRHTSTPNRSRTSVSPMIVPSINGNGLEDSQKNGSSFEDVFDDDGLDKVIDESLNLSPISLKARSRGIRTGETITSILAVGGDDNLGLNPFQGVTSQVDGSVTIFNNCFNKSYNSVGSDDDELNSSTSKYLSTTTIDNEQLHSPFGDDLTILSGNILNGDPLSLTPRPIAPKSITSDKSVSRVLFSENTPDRDENTIEYQSDSSGTITAKNESSWDFVSSSDLSSSTLLSDSVKSDKTLTSWDVVPSDEVSSHLSSATEAKEQENRDDFWIKQMESLTQQAKQTKSLFDLSLETDKFVEDIEAANDESGSLVLHDLEDLQNPTVVPQTKSSSQSPPIQDTKLAFTGPNNTSIINSESISSSNDHDTTTSVLPWDNHNNSIDIMKSKKSATPLPLHFNNPAAININTHSDEDGSGNEDSEQAGSNNYSTPLQFIPSTWNHSLTPARPAIKSPSDPTLVVGQQQSNKSNLKKSVSFERKKAQIVYEYPPPPPASDSEEEASLLAHARSSKDSLPLSSSLDWELNQDELDFAPCNQEESDEEETVKIKHDPMDVYRISGFLDDTSFHTSASNEPFNIQPQVPSILGELRHTRDKLRLDLSKGEASLLDEDVSSSGNKASSAKLLDSGVGSSANVSPAPFSSSHCDNPN